VLDIKKGKIGITPNSSAKGVQDQARLRYTERGKKNGEAGALEKSLLLKIRHQALIQK
jgi:hypothetical protein